MRNLKIALSLCFSLSTLWSLSVSAQIDTAGLHFPALSACPGDTIFFPLTVILNDSTDLAGFQFGVSWGDNQLSYLGTCELAISTEDQVVTVQSPTTVQFTWVDFGSEILSLMDGDTLLILKFLAEDIPPNGVDVIFDATVSPFEIVTANFSAYVPNTSNGQITRDETINLITSAEAIDCRDSLAQLFVTSSQPSTTFSWTGPNSFIDSIANPFTDTIGLYTVIGQNGNCFDTAQIMVVYDTITPTNLELFADTLTCSNNTVDLRGNVSEGNVNYQWSTIGGMNLDPDTNQVMVTMGGAYVLDATFNENGCSVRDTITVAVDTLTPDLALSNSPLVLDCNTESIELLATSSNMQVSWEWKLMGNAAVLSATDSIVVTMAGEYQVLITDLENGCQDSLLVNILQNTLSPDFQVNGDTTLTCGEPIQQLVAQSTASLDYEWYNSTATLLSSEDSIIVSISGVYELFGTDPLNGCSDSLTITIVTDTIAPITVLSATNDTLNCLNESVLFSVVTPTPDRDYQWQNNTADSLSSATQISLSVPGDYQLVTTDLSNGCSSLLPLTVAQDTLVPTFQILPPDTLTCGVLSVSLNIVPDDPTSLCEWSGLDTSCTVEVGNAGWYQAQVTNPENGCIATDSVEVIISPNNVSVSIAADFPGLTCQNPSIILTANANSSVTWQWENENEDLLGSEDTLSITSPGTYFVFVEDDLTNCLASDSIIITENTVLPLINLLGDSVLTCIDSTQIWRADVPGGEVLSFAWIDNQGMVLSNSDTLVVDTSGSYQLLVTDPANGCMETLNFDVSQNILSPEAEVVPVSATLDCLTDSVSFEFVTSVMDYEVVWGDATGTAVGFMDSLLLAEPGDYQLLLTDLTNGCQTEEAFTLLIDTLPPTFTFLVPDTLNCVQETVTLSIEGTSPGHLCSWLQIADDCEIVVNEAGTYLAEVTNPQNGCQSRDSLTVVSNAEVLVTTVAVSQEINCLNDSAALTITDALPSVAYVWSGPPGTNFATGPMITVTQAGSYEVIGVAADSGCRDSVTVFVAENFSAPSGEATSSGDLDCQQTVVELSVLMSDPSTTFTWVDASEMEIDPTMITTAGTYYLLLENNSSFCTRIDSVTVLTNDTPPDLNWSFVGDSIITCNQTEVELNASSSSTPVTITWTETASGTLLQTGSSFVSTIPQDIQLTIVDNQTSCSQDTIITITADQEPPIAIASALSAFDCLTMEALLGSASPGVGEYTYNWLSLEQGGTPPSSPDQEQTLVSQPGFYELVIENLQNGCVAADTIEVVDNSLNAGEVSLLIVNPGCANATGSIEVLNVTGGTAPHLYSLDNGALSAQSFFGGLEAGNYLLTVEDAAGCSFDTLLSIVPAPTLEISIDVDEGPYQLGDVIDLEVVANRLLTPQDSAVWYQDGSLICNDCLVVTDTLIATITYTVTVIGSDGCEVTTDITLVVNENIQVGIPNIFSPNDDNTNDLFLIYPHSSVVSIEEWIIFDRWGNLVFQRTDLPLNDFSIGWDGRFNGQKPVPSGVYVYYIRLKLINGKEVEKKGDVTVIR
jgi:gliding motility-associated-like protein